MAKKIYSQFIGTGKGNRNLKEWELSVAEDISIDRDFGYLRPFYGATSVNNTDELSGYIRDIERGSDTASYAVDGTKLHQINSGNIRKTSPFPHTGASPTSVALYNHNKNGLFIMGVFYLGSSGGHFYGNVFDDDYLNSVPVGALPFEDSSIHPHKIWMSNLMIGDGRYVIKYDGTDGNDGTIYPKYFDVGKQWIIRDFFNMSTTLGIITRAYYTEYLSEVVFIDGSSGVNAVRRITIKENITACIPYLGDIIVFTRDTNNTGFIKRLTSNGLETLWKLETENTSSGSMEKYIPPISFGYRDYYEDKIIFTVQAGFTSKIMLFGKTEDKFSFTTLATLQGAYPAACKNIDSEDIFASSYTLGATNTYYLQKFVSGSVVNAYSTSAVAKMGYADMGQKIRVNYIKFYFKPLVSGDVVTPTIEADYGTSWTLTDPKGNTTISYANDGAITSKKFNVKRDCHAFRPAIAWSSGGTAISKIVVDYTFLKD
jgi:hypothetical protein